MRDRSSNQAMPVRRDPRILMAYLEENCGVYLAGFECLPAGTALALDLRTIGFGELDSQPLGLPDRIAAVATRPFAMCTVDLAITNTMTSYLFIKGSISCGIQ